VFDRKLSGDTQPELRTYLKETGSRITRRVEEWLGAKGSGPGPKIVPDAQSGNADRGLSEREVVGRLSIPRLGLHAVVREGTADQTLSIALGHIAGTALPGQNGNVGIAGHRDALFRELKAISPRDEVRVDTVDARYIYRVESSSVIKPSDVVVLKAGAYPEITLVTCCPINNAGSAPERFPERFMVKARQVAQIPLGEPPLAETTPLQPSKPDLVAPVPVLAPAEQNPHPISQIKPETQDKKSLRRIAFEVGRNRSRELAPGISLGVTSTDPARKSVDAWLWLVHDRRTIWLREQTEGNPVSFETGDNHGQWRLVVTQITTGSIRGYLVGQ